jgi:hypothetical protein
LPDELEITTPAAAPVEAVAAPAEAAPVIADEPAASDVPVEAVKPALHTDTETLLEGVTKKPDAPAETAPDAPKPEEVKAEAEKPVEPPKPEEAAKPEVKAEAKPEAAPVEPIVYEDFTLPNGLKPDADKMEIYRGVLQEYHLPQDAGQKMLDLHTTAMQSYADSLATEQHKVFGDMRAEWRQQIMADDILGGAGHQTAMKAVARARDALISSAKPGTPEFASHEKEFNDFLRITGAGDHPALIRMLHNAARKLDEPAPMGAQIKPPPNNGRAPGKAGLRQIYNPTPAK